MDKAEVRKEIWGDDFEDMVNHPPHYTQGGIECIDAIEASMSPEEFAGFLKGQVIKYMWRFEKKWDPKQDAGKAKFYLDRLVDFMGEHPDLFRNREFKVDIQPTQEINIGRHIAEDLTEALAGVDRVVADS